MNKPRSYTSRGFTLIELLTVIAIIGILAGIIIPTTGAVRTAAKKSQSRTQFNQIVTAMEMFRQEYGYYPRIDDGGNPGTRKIDTDRFFAILTAKTVSGGTPTDFLGNKKRMSFYSVSDKDLDDTKTQLVDGFGNTEIGVVVDRDGNGVISGSGNEALVAVNPGNYTPTVPTAGIRAGVIIYSSGKDGSSNNVVKSWE